LRIVYISVHHYNHTLRIMCT